MPEMTSLHSRRALSAFRSTTMPLLQEPARISGAPVYSVYRYRKHGVCVRFELYEPSLGCHLVATLIKKAPTLVYQLNEWRTNNAIGWLCANLKGDRLVLYETLRLGEDLKEAVATLALGWTLGDDLSRRVDVVRLDPTIYATHRHANPEKVTPLGQGTKNIVERVSSESVMARRHHQPLSVHVPIIAEKGSASVKREHSPISSPASISSSGGTGTTSRSSSSLVVRRKAKALRLDLAEIQETGGALCSPLISKMQSGASPKTQQSGCGRLLDDPYANRETPVEEASHSPPSPLAKVLSTLRLGGRPRTSVNNYTPLDDAPLDRSPVSVLECRVGPSESPTQRRPPSPKNPVASMTLTGGTGGKDLIYLLETILEKSIDEVELPAGATALRSAQPVWSELCNGHTLSFGGLVHQKSVQNTVLLAFGEGGVEKAHASSSNGRGVLRRCVSAIERGASTDEVLIQSLLSSEETTYDSELGTRALIFGRHYARDGSEFVCSHDSGKLSKLQAFSISVACCLKKAVFDFV